MQSRKKPIRPPINAFKQTFKKRSYALITEGIIINDKNGEKTEGKFLWDTGATCSAINKNLSKPLDLAPIGFETVKTANGDSQCSTSVISMAFQELNVKIRDVQVTLANLQDDLLALIGMDIIGLGSFLVQHNHLSNRNIFQFALPSLDKINEVDFIQACYNENQKNQKKLKKQNPKHPLLSKYSIKPKIKI